MPGSVGKEKQFQARFKFALEDVQSRVQFSRGFSRFRNKDGPLSGDRNPQIIL